MSPSLARQQLLQTSAILEALRPQADIVAGGGNPADDPIREAWAKALNDFRDACQKWVAAQ